MTDAILAVGAVLWRPATDDGQAPGTVDGVEVLLVHRPRYDDWSLPRGKREPGEHALLTAAREVFEETSVRPVLGPRLPTVEYLSRGRRKRVDYWTARARGAGGVWGGGEPPQEQGGSGGDRSPRGNTGSGGDRSPRGNTVVSWLPLPKAAQQVSYSHDAELISGLQPRETIPLILVRHASAGHKEDWPGADELRPLDAKGVADAQVLARLLACFAPRARVVSSPTLRCTQTMRPYTEGFGGTVEAEPVLAPPGGPSSRTSSDASVRHLIGDLVAAGRPAVVCLHRENLRKALVAACSALGAPSAVPQDPSLSKGAFWVVHASAGELAGLECYEP